MQGLIEYLLRAFHEESGCKGTAIANDTNTGNMYMDEKYQIIAQASASLWFIDNVRYIVGEGTLSCLLGIRRLTHSSCS